MVPASRLLPNPVAIHLPKKSEYESFNFRQYSHCLRSLENISMAEFLLNLLRLT